MSAVITLIVVAAAVLLGIALAYVPMRLLLSHMGKAIRQFIQRQRDRRAVARGTPDRRRVDEAIPTAENEAHSKPAPAP